MKGGLSKEVVSDEGEASIKRGGLSPEWSLKRGIPVTTVFRYT